MPPVYDLHGVTVLHGDCLAVLADLPDASVDAVVTDPPYGLEFMGKEWDRFAGAVTDRDFKGFVLSQQRTRNVKCPDCQKWAYDHPGRLCECGGIRRAQGSTFQAWCEQWTAECLRVLKPGGYLLAFGGTRTYHRLACAIEDVGFEIRDSIDWIYGSGFPKGKQQLKPAHEPIVMARKPLSGTVASNVLAHGTGALNIAGCRVSSTDELVRPSVARTDNEVYGKGLGAGIQTEPSGRWPSNVVLTHSPDCADECTPGCPVAELDRQSGTLKSGRLDRSKILAQNAIYGMAPKVLSGEYEPNSGGASRFFPTFRYQAKAPTSERPKVNGVAHPTCKPLTLMRWLVRLVCPPGGVVLDPFLGSGTTAQAARDEGFRCIGIEREAEYLDLIRARLDRPPATVQRVEQDALPFGEDAA